MIKLNISEKDQLRFMSIGIAKYVQALEEEKEKALKSESYDRLKVYMDMLHGYKVMQTEIEDAYTRATLYGVEE